MPHTSAPQKVTGVFAMASTPLVMSNTDREAIITVIESCDLVLLWNRRYETPTAPFDQPTALRGARSGEVYLLKRDWCFEQFIFLKHSSKVTGEVYYDLHPRVNFYALSLDFYSERLDTEPRQLGFGDISSFPSWLEMPARVLHRAPAESANVYRFLTAAIKKGGGVVRTRSGKQFVMKGALEGYLAGGYMMHQPWLDTLARNQLIDRKG